MVVEIISVGTEILLGNIVNTNAAYLAEKCAGLGLSCYEQHVIGDNEERLSALLHSALKRADILLLTGGLGPTKDDLTKETVARVLGREMYLHEASREAIIQFFKKRGIEPTDNNWKQAMVPERSIVIRNPNGTAPGIIVKENGKHVILMPGPPNELIPMFENAIIPYLGELEPGIIYSKTVKLCGVGESKAESMIEDMIDAQGNPTIAPYAKTGEVHLRVTAKAEKKKQAKELVEPIVIELQRRFGHHVYTTENNVTLEQSVVDLLIKKHMTIATAESCTGGMLAARLINVPGVSDVYKAGYVTYANKAKKKLLGIDKKILKKEGAVSRAVAGLMAKQAALLAETDVGVGITGIAGPEGGTDKKPVGLVYIGCYVRGDVRVKRYLFSGSRGKIRESSVAAALTFIRKEILEGRKG